MSGNLLESHSSYFVIHSKSDFNIYFQSEKRAQFVPLRGNPEQWLNCMHVIEHYTVQPGRENLENKTIFLICLSMTAVLM